MRILVLNCGSSTLKFRVIETGPAEMERDGDRELARGLVERIGGPEVADHREALTRVIPGVVRRAGDVHAVGHRVVHGGELFRESVRIDAAVVAGIERCAELAPLHNPANLQGIRAAAELLGDAMPQVAVFDTAFHVTLPESACLYGMSPEFQRRLGIRRYGFHGISHRWLAGRYRRLRGLREDEVNIVTLHLGNGCSACAIRGGKLINTSMGFTPLEGLIMGTRSGDIDPSILEYLSRREGMGAAEVLALLNQRSGLLGVSGLTNDMRELLAAEAAGHAGARLAVEMFTRRAIRCVGGYLAELGGAEAVVFSGGIGENSAEIRARISRGLAWMGLDLDPAMNELAPSRAGREISRPGSRLKAYVIPTDEELLIARDTARVIEEETPVAAEARGEAG